MADLLKNMVSVEFVRKLASTLEKRSRHFNKRSFLNQVVSEDWEDLALKQRYSRIVKGFAENLKGPYSEQIEVLCAVAPSVRGLNGIIFPEFVSTYGLKDWKISVEALKSLTPYSTSEFAVRYFIKENPEKMLKIMKIWAKDSNEHVRRLSSEGLRPRLPWSFRLECMIQVPREAVAVLELLKQDDSLYVRKSVANHLNDISKDSPDLVLEVAEQWYGKDERTDWILKHGLRTLLKGGNKRALKIFGLSDSKGLDVQDLRFISKKVSIGRHIEFRFKMTNRQNGEKNIRVEYAIHYLKQNGSYSKKVFKLAEKKFPKGQVEIHRRHSVKQMTTRNHLVGKHKLDIVVNGLTMASEEFYLI